MKNIFLPSLLAFALFAAAVARADDPVIQTWRDPENPYDWRYYERADGTRVICGLTIPNKPQIVTVPDFNGTVREIAPHACENMSYLSSIRFPDCITNIGEYAFAGCGMYISNLPTNLTGLGTAAFKNCWLVQNGRCPAFPPRLERIPDYAFYGCNAWGEALVLPAGLKEIGDYGISYEGHSEWVTIPNSVTNIGSGVFKGLPYITSISLPPGLVNLGGERTFSGCSSLREISLPAGMKRVGTEMFRMCRSLTNVVIPDSVESIGPSAFYYCTNLTSITLPANLVSISANAFDSCPLTGEFTIPLNTAFMEAGALAQIWAWSNTGPVETLQTLRLPRQFEGRLDEIAPFGIRNGRPVVKPNGLQIVYYGPYNLRVESAYGTPTPDGPVNHHEEGTPFSCSVSPAQIETEDTRRRCTGWTGTGDVPATGTGTNVSFTTTLRNSSLVWNWESEYRIACSVSGAATAFSATNWLSEGGTFYAPFSPTAPSFRVEVSGDADGVVVDETEGRIAIPADRARQVSVEVVQILETETTPVPVPHAWLDEYPALLAAHNGDHERFANSTNAANGRAVWQCYALGLSPDGPDDFRITSFPMKTDGTPDFGGISFVPPQSAWRLTNAVPVIQGRSGLSDGEQWRDVPSGGDPSLRFFRVKMEVR